MGDTIIQAPETECNPNGARSAAVKGSDEQQANPSSSTSVDTGDEASDPDGETIAAQKEADAEERLPTKEDQGPPPSAQTVAETILKWAKEHRLFAKTSMEDAAEAIEAEPTPEISAAQMFSTVQVEAVLRRRAINMIVFNEPGKKVIVYTKSRVTAGDIKIIPYATKGISIEYSVGWNPTVKGNIPSPHERRPYQFHNGRYCCGNSIFTGNCMGAGTMGFLAKDEHGAIYGVTNNHVTGACNHSPPGMPILAPGPADIVEDSIEPFCIGRHYKLIPINDGIPENMDISGNLDVSSFKIVDDAPVCSMQGILCDTPAAVDNPTPGAIVEKIGRTTGHTRGRIVGQSAAPLSVLYMVPEYGVRKSVFFKTVFVVEGIDGDFSQRGG